MLEPIAHILSKQRNVLASTSPRRSSLLKTIGLNFEVIGSDFEEDLAKDKFPHPCEFVKENAKQKAIHVWNKLKSKGETADLIIGADTVVSRDETIFEKPKDKEDALNILTRLSGKWHTVFTGVAIITNSNSGNNDKQGSPLEDSPEFLVTTFHEATHVYMCTLPQNIIKSYIETGEPMDKAGAYSIQGIGATLIETIKGDYFNVVGLPLHRLAKELFHIYSE